MAKPRLRKELIEALRQVRRGGDVYCPRISRLLREVQRRAPDLILIGKPQMYRGNGVGVVPYFGAIATDKGRAFLRRHRAA
ncbi:MAG: hypothetical protein AAB368_14145 [bacterium]